MLQILTYSNGKFGFQFLDNLDKLKKIEDELRIEAY